MNELIIDALIEDEPKPEEEDPIERKVRELNERKYELMEEIHDIDTELLELHRVYGVKIK